MNAGINQYRFRARVKHPISSNMSQYTQKPHQEIVTSITDQRADRGSAGRQDCNWYLARFRRWRLEAWRCGLGCASTMGLDGSQLSFFAWMLRGEKFCFEYDVGGRLINTRIGRKVRTYITSINESQIPRLDGPTSFGKNTYCLNLYFFCSCLS